MERKVEFRVHDAVIGLSQDDARDPSWSRDIYGGIVRHLRDRGWSVRRDPRVHQHYRVLSPHHREGAKGDLRCAVEVGGRCIKIEFWARTWPLDNRNGRRHDFEKLSRMQYLDRLRFRLEVRHLLDWLQARATTMVSQATEAHVGPGGLTAREAIARDYATSWHTDKLLGHPVPTSPYNCTSADGETIEHGATVWFVDRGGRVGRGTALYHINNMWWVVTGAWSRRNLHTGEIFVHAPLDLRTKRNERDRRRRLEEELAKSVRRMDFRRAELLKGILFGDAPVYLIWARDHDAYYRSNYAGYTRDVISAGRYTLEEARREVTRVPHELVAIGPDGRRVSFEEKAA